MGDGKSNEKLQQQSESLDEEKGRTMCLPSHMLRSSHTAPGVAPSQAVAIKAPHRLTIY